MAQAFEIPRGNRTVYRGLLATGQAAIAKYPATLSRSPLPVRPSDGIGNWNMGPTSDRRKHLSAGLARPVTGPIPGSATDPRLIVSVRFDKGRPLPV
jgi:hypothetical protein